MHGRAANGGGEPGIVNLAARAGAVRRASSIVTTIAIVLALVKVRLIFREFMQVRKRASATAPDE